jgi:hypothetical protein
MNILLSVVVLILFALCVYIIINLFRKLEFLEKNYIILLDKLESTIINMREIDDKQMFENDDEVGVIFRELTDTVNELSKFVVTEEGT